MPERLPSIAAIRRRLDPPLSRALTGLVVRGSQGLDDAAIAGLRPLLDRLPAARLRAKSPGARGSAGPLLADDATHDRYFGIARSGGPRAGIFLRSLLSAIQLFAEEQACVAARVRPRFRAVGDGLLELLGAVLDVPGPGVRYAAPELLAPTARTNPMRRWLIGHQVFLVLTQGITIALEEFALSGRSAARTGRTAAALDASRSLQLATDLMTASAVAFRFTADFGAGTYAREVRPSMQAHAVGEGFSGLLSVDHRCLVATLGRLRPRLQRRRATLAGQRALAEALARIYADHRFVCARFVGQHEPSLRSPHATNASGVRQLDRLARTRIRMLGLPSPRSA